MPSGAVVNAKTPLRAYGTPAWRRFFDRVESPASMSLSQGTRLGPLEVIAPLGAGGMGEVYRARDTRWGARSRSRSYRTSSPPTPTEGPASSRKRAPPRPSTTRTSSPSTRSAARTRPSTSRWSRRRQATPYIARSRSTARRCATDGRSAAPAPPWAPPHRRARPRTDSPRRTRAGIVHRDIKPENVMASRPTARSDRRFRPREALKRGAGGRVERRHRRSTVAGTVIGTAGYMSPEQASGGPIDFGSDQFALGSILYEMATGKRAFQRGTSARPSPRSSGKTRSRSAS